MKVYSNIITRQHILGAVSRPENHAYLIDGVREFEPRRPFARGFQLYLGGNQPIKSAHDSGHFAASWDDWGDVIAALFKVDPQAIIGFYNGVDDFVKFTTDMAQRNTRRTAPWLSDRALLDLCKP